MPSTYDAVINVMRLHITDMTNFMIAAQNKKEEEWIAGYAELSSHSQINTSRLNINNKNAWQ